MKAPKQRGAGKDGVATPWRAGRTWPTLPDSERWTHIPRLLWIVALCLMLGGCATVPRDVRAVWTEKAPPPVDLAAPAGFSVTPVRAYFVVLDSRSLSMKHAWHVYADSRYYYVHDTFLGDSPGRAYAQGVRVDGQTGEIVGR